MTPLVTDVRAPIFGPSADLPRGPHGLSRDEVAASQRTRLLVAITDVVAEKGYASASITEITRRAGVSPKTFYEHFTDKLDCFLAAYDTFAQVLLERIAAELGGDDDWDSFVDAALRAYLGTLERNPSAARAFLVEIDGAGPEARKRRRRAYDQFAVVFKARHEATRESDPSLGPLPDRAYLGMVHGVRALVCEALETRARPKLRPIADDVRAWLTATIQGARAES